MQISHETIYQYVYCKPKGDLKKQLLKYLRQKRNLNRNRKNAHEKRGQIPDLASIHDRPEEVEDRRVPGHSEGDLILGEDHKTVLGVLVERSSRFIYLVPLKAKRAVDVREAYTDQFMELSPELRKTLTCNQGKEMVQHKKFSEDTGIAVYFADPHSPWQKGSCENTNGLIRNFSKVSYEKIKHV
jgi:IS30 family transposase